jgi:hypothetical protein
VRTGRRPEYGLQLYYSADGTTVRNSAGWEKDGCSGDIRAGGGYVMAAGSIHPSGAAYETVSAWEWEDGYYHSNPLPPAPEWVKELAPARREFDPSVAVDDATANEWKTYLYEFASHYQIDLRGYEKRVVNGWWIGIICPWADTHTTGAGVDSSTVLGILDGLVVFECSHGTCKAEHHDTAFFRRHIEDKYGAFMPVPKVPLPPTITLGSKAATGLPDANMNVSTSASTTSDWREHYHTQDELLNTPPVSFLIENFLPYQSITALAAPVRQRKSLVALNVAHSLCSGEPLFGRFAITQKPSRVLYLCPEMGLRSFVDRARKIGLLDYAGDTFYCRTMNMPGVLGLKDLTSEELDGAVVIVDTLIRYQRGDENSSRDMSALSAQAFELIEKGAAALLVLHHSQKNTGDQDALTLENVMRGSGELGAAMTNAWATRLQRPDDEYGSPSYLQNVKPRDYKPDPKAFEVSCSEDTCRMTFIESDGPVKLRRANSGNKDGLENAALAVIKAHPDKSIRELASILKETGINRGRDWVRIHKAGMSGGGSVLSEEEAKIDAV